jgi:hypothetical protein
MLYDIAKGAAQKGINQKNFYKLKIYVPSLEKQKKIVSYCESNDSKIKQLEEELERNKLISSEIMSSIFKETNKELDEDSSSDEEESDKESDEELDEDSSSDEEESDKESDEELDEDSSSDKELDEDSSSDKELDEDSSSDKELDEDSSSDKE